MTSQLRYAIVEAAYSYALVILAVAGSIISLDTSYRGAAQALVAGLIPVLKRVYEGYKDGIRARDGSVIASDVKPNLPVIVERTGTGQTIGPLDIKPAAANARFMPAPPEPTSLAPNGMKRGDKALLQHVISQPYKSVEAIRPLPHEDPTPRRV